MRVHLIALALVTACKVSGVTFVTPDAEVMADAHPDAAPGTVAFVVSEGTLTFVEGMPAKTFTIALDAPPPSPTEDIVVQIMSTSTDVTANPSLMLFTPSTLATPQTVTVTAVTDTDYNFTSAAINITSSKVPDTAAVAVLVIEPGILQLTTTSGIICPGDPITTSLKLRGDPAGALMVTATATPTGGTLNPAIFMFDSTNFGTTQNVTFSYPGGPTTVLNDFKVPAQSGITTVRYTLSVRSPSTPVCVL